MKFFLLFSGFFLLVISLEQEEALRHLYREIEIPRIEDVFRNLCPDDNTENLEKGQGSHTFETIEGENPCVLYAGIGCSRKNGYMIAYKPQGVSCFADVCKVVEAERSLEIAGQGICRTSWNEEVQDVIPECVCSASNRYGYGGILEDPPHLILH